MLATLLLTASVFVEIHWKSRPFEAQSPAPTTPAAKPEVPRTPRPPVPPRQPGSVGTLPPLTADPPVMDFGFLAPNTPGIGTITLTNASDAPLTIELVQPSCKCTTITKLDGTVIAPGASEHLKIKLDGAPAMGMRRSSVKVMVEGFGRPLDIPVKGEVSLPIRTVPPYVNAVGGKNLMGRMVVESLDRKPFRILSTFGAPMTVQGLDGPDAPPRASYLVAYDLTGSADNLPTHLYIETDCAEAAVADVRVRNETIDRSMTIDLVDKRSVIGRMTAGEPSEAIFTTRNARHAVDKATSDSADIAVEFMKAERAKDGGLMVVVRVTPRAGFKGFLKAPFTLWAGEIQQVVEVIGSVQPATAAVPAAVAP
ncbi:MAG: DUF1573 domain-containing protein [Phycisphaerales bacterium]|nr:DUF1573 domain-containing protein [Phycisphaerales bacterium]